MLLDVITSTNLNMGSTSWWWEIVRCELRLIDNYPGYHIDGRDVTESRQIKMSLRLM